ncbi:MULTISPECIES: hypothetical protein [unclassified Modicisalibacter]|uniref:hypothetical protein n=1 Tax=unclassified Modicisalibacter TaxID=2679913 RepID=UPI001CCFB654|nr:MULTISPECIES: hypothetical protein [unclassified Modicisalibacter]MBZ9559044.1 hypothetical protein [Modicisalibacter sp. R2A 31.J]MBZ9576845.1 hypothetical protein [Modicisalibacter sp. MOD 31.J]
MHPAFARAAVITSGFSSIIAISNSFSGLVTFYGHLKSTFDTYQFYIRDPISSALDYLWPQFIFPLPTWAPDYIIILALSISSLTFMEQFTRSEHRLIPMTIKGFLYMPRLLSAVIKNRKQMNMKEKNTIPEMISYRLFVFMILIVIGYTIIITIFLITLPIWLILYLIGTMMFYGKIKGRGPKLMFTYLGFIALGCFSLVALNEQYRDYCENSTDSNRAFICQEP